MTSDTAYANIGDPNTKSKFYRKRLYRAAVERWGLDLQLGMHRRRREKKKMIEENNRFFRQGDVLLISTKDNEEALPKTGTAVLAYGEVSGHSHQLKGVNHNQGMNGLSTIVEVPEQGAVLSHEEHEPITIPQGRYQVRIQREYDVVEGIRQVMD